ncbi:MAG: hypothetical protein KC501_21480 [Myxococcales bacterium]|nr:hypothetical protein [Myxococcales bacterium]
MLSLETPYYEIEGIVVFRDHALPTLFHYLAGPPRLTVRDGKPHFRLLKYREALAGSTLSPSTRDQLGGGFLTFGVDCRVDEETLDAVRTGLIELLSDQIASLEDEIALVPVLYTKGTVRLLAIDQCSGLADAEPEPATSTPQSRFVRGILGTATPSLMGHQEAIFSVALAPDGVALIEGAYRAELSPIGVIYELELSGLRPALAVRVRTDQKKVYQSLKMELGLGIEAGTDAPASEGETRSSPRGVALDAELSRAVASLVESGAIEIELLQQQEGPEVDRIREAAMKMVKEDILAEMFSPTPTAQAAPSLDSATRGAGELAASTAALGRGLSSGHDQDHALELGFQLRYKKEEELEVRTYRYDVARPEPRTHAPNAFFSLLTRDTTLDQHITEVGLDDPFFQLLQLEVETTTTDFARLGLQTIVVELQYGGTLEAPRQSASLLFTPADPSPKGFRAFRDQDDFSYRYRVDYRFADSDEVAAASLRHTTEWRTTTKRTLVVHPPEDLDLLQVYVEPAVVDWKLVRTIEVALAYSDPASGFRSERSYVLEEGSPRREWVLRIPVGAPREYSVRPTWTLANGTKVSGEPTVHAHPRLFVEGPFTGRLRVRVVPAVDPTSVGLIVGELVHVDPGTGLESRRSLSLEPPFRPTTLELPLIDPAHDEYSWSYRLFAPGASTPAEEKGPIVGNAKVQVISEGDVVHLEIEVVIVGDLAAAEVLAVQVDLRAPPPPGRQPQIHSLLFEMGGETRIKQRLALRADRDPLYEVQTTVMTMGGDAIVSEWNEHTGPVLGLDLATLMSPPQDG